MNYKVFIFISKIAFCFLPLILILLCCNYLDAQKIVFPAYSAAMGGIAGFAATGLLFQKFIFPKEKFSVTRDYSKFFKHIMNRHNINDQLKDLLASYEQIFTSNNPFEGRTIFIFYKDGEWHKKEIDNPKKTKAISISTFQNEFPIAKKRFRIRFTILRIVACITPT